MLTNRNRRSMRLKGYDYALPGAYFITLVSWHRDEIFGQVENDTMILSPLGEIVHQEWFRSASIRREIRLFEDEFIVMPNHLHGIVWIVDTSSDLDANLAPLPSQPKPGVMHVPQRKPKSLSSFIAGYKASVTSHAKNELDITGIWQRNYYDHIIRNVFEFQKIWDYIDINPRTWNNDQMHPSRNL